MLTEDDLRTRLRALTEPVQGAADPVGGVRRRVRVLRRRRAGMTVALAVVVVLALGFVAGFGPLNPRHQTPVPGGSASPTPSALPPAKAPDLTHLRSAEQVWSKQLRVLPNRLPDGRDYAVCGALGGGRYLIAISAGKDQFRDIAVMDARNGYALTVLSDASAGQGTTLYHPEQPVLTPDGVAWQASAERGGRWTTEIWASTLAARSAKLLTTMPGQEVVRLGQLWAVGDRVLFTKRASAPDSPLYSVPRSGGQPRLVTGSVGHYAVSGAWTSTQPASGSLAVGLSPSLNFELFNVLTGQRIPVRPNPATMEKPLRGSPHNTLTCTPNWCLGATRDGGTLPGIAVQHPDGSGYVQANMASPTSTFGNGRFVDGMVWLDHDRVQDFLWDVVTGAAGTFGPPSKLNGHSLRFIPDPGQTTFTWPGPDGKVVLDTTLFG